MQKLHVQKAGDHTRQHAEAGGGLYDQNERSIPRRILCRHLVDVILGERYVFSADFLARGYRFDRLSAEKMWHMTCFPEMTTFADVAQAVFTGNPDCLNVEEAERTWTSQPTTEIQSFPYTTDVSRTKYDVNKRKNDVRTPTGPKGPDNSRLRLPNSL